MANDSSSVFDIHVGTTWIKFHVAKYNRSTIANHVDLQRFYNDSTIEWDRDARTGKWSVRYTYMHYDPEEGTMSLPRNMLDSLKQYISDADPDLIINEIEEDPVRPKRISLQMRPEFKPRNDEQYQIIDFMTDPTTTFKPIAARTGLGKGLVDDTPVLTPNGWVEISSLKVGDLVTAVDGTDVPVTGVYPQGEESTFLFTFANGSTIETDADHLWEVQIDGNDTSVVTSTLILHSMLSRSIYHVTVPTFKSDDRLVISKIEKTGQYKSCTCIAIDHPRKLYVAKDYIVTHNTFCAEAAICKLGFRAMVILNSLVDQWYESILQQIAIDPDDVYVIRGFDSLSKLWKKFSTERYRPKIFLIASRTLYSYAVNPEDQYLKVPSYECFLKTFGIGTKVVDECHLGFNTTTLIDLNTNVRHSIYLSATYMRTDPMGRKIFNKVFPPEMCFGQQFNDKYTTVYMVGYKGIQVNNEWAFRVAKGYNHSKYEAYMLRYDRVQKYFYAMVLQPLIEDYFIRMRKPGQRLLILCITRAYATDLAVRVAKSYPKLVVGTYFSGDKSDDPIDPLSADVVISTIKSAGTGLDIKQLKTAINTVSFSSPVQANQVLGRLRKLPNEDTIFVDLYNKNVSSHRVHQDHRAKVYAAKAKSLKYISI